MAVRLPDFKVRFRREESIAQTAKRWREVDINYRGTYFNIVDFVEIVLKRRLKDSLRVELVDADDNLPAFVTFNPPDAGGKREIVLTIDREIWELARQGDPKARFIVAHEIGHVVLHDHEAKAFSEDEALRINFADEGYSAEWQAETFALYFLMPAYVVAMFDSAEALARAAFVDSKHALVRFNQVADAIARIARLSGAPCPKCGMFGMDCAALTARCSKCGHQEQVY